MRKTRSASLDTEPPEIGLLTDHMLFYSDNSPHVLRERKRQLTVHYEALRVQALRDEDELNSQFETFAGVTT